MGIVTVHTCSFHHRHVLLQFRGFLVTGKANLFLRHRQVQCGHVALDFRHMTDRARSRHRRVHRPPADLLGVTRGAFDVLGKNAGMLNGPQRHRRQQQKQECDSRAAKRSHVRRAILASCEPTVISQNLLAEADLRPRTSDFGRGGKCRGAVKV